MNFKKSQFNQLANILTLCFFVGMGMNSQAANEPTTLTEYTLGNPTQNPFSKFEVDRRTDLLDLEVNIKKKSSLVLRVLNEAGKEVFHSATEVIAPRFRTRVDLASFPQGKYKIVIYTNDGRYVRHFQK